MTDDRFETGWSADTERHGYNPAVKVGPPGHFLTPLDLRLLEQTEAGRNVWTLLRPLEYESPLLGRVVTVPAGFVTDLESVPNVLRSFTGRPCPRAGVTHDWLYQSHEEPKDVADLVYHEACLADGLHVVYADQRFGVVSYYGYSAYRTGPERKRVVVV